MGANGANSMAVSDLGCRKALLGTISVPVVACGGGPGWRIYVACSSSQIKFLHETYSR